MSELQEEITRIKELNPESNESKDLQVLYYNIIQEERDKWREKAENNEEIIHDYEKKKEKYELEIKDYQKEIKTLESNINDLEESLKQSELDKQTIISRMETLEKELTDQSNKYSELINEKVYYILLFQEKSLEEVHKEYEEQMSVYSEIIATINENMNNNILAYLVLYF